MKDEVWAILHSLQDKNQVVTSIEKKTGEMLNGIYDVELLIKDLKREIYLTSDLQSSNLLYYCFYLAIAYLKLNDIKNAKVILADAVQGFRMRGLSFNEAMGERLFGVLHLKRGDTIQAQKACETSLAILTQLLKEYKEESDYESARICADRMENVQNLIETLINPLPTIEEYNVLKRSVAQNESDFMVLPWLPRYESVCAGRNGIIWVEPAPKHGAIIRTIEIDGKLCKLISTHTTTNSVDHQINLAQNVSYGWAKVEGKSMNASKPVPIEEGDYVLFSTQPRNASDHIVIVSRALTDNEYAYMVKKYIARENVLISETTDSSQDYSPIPLGKDNQILGTVIAIAKPT